MKAFLKVNNAKATTNWGLLFLRVGIAALMLTHGIPKLGMLFSQEPFQFPPVLGMSALLSLALTIFSEVVCSLFILIGLTTRLAAIPLAITMAVAALYIHGADPFSVQEMSLHFLLVYLVLIFTGSGRYSVDHLLQSKSSILNQTAEKTQMPALFNEKN